MTFRSQAPVPVGLFVLLLLGGCSEELINCTHEWSQCTALCPSEEAEQQAIDRAEAEYQECLEGCPVLDPNSSEEQQLKAGKCIKACSDTEAAAIKAATACSDACDYKFAECIEDLTGCNDPAQTSNLLRVNVSDWNKHSGGSLSDPNHGVFICEDHFPAGSPQRSEVTRSVDQYTNVPGASIGLFSMFRPHAQKSEIFAVPPTVSSFDYVDNAADSFVHPCHPDNTTACSDSPGVNGFAVNTCPYQNGDWKGGGKTDFFEITANAACYGYYTNPASSNYVTHLQALHELGHATGMQHTDEWPTRDLAYISTMEGRLEYLSAYDVAFLRHFYQSSYPSSFRNFVASSRIRMDLGRATEVDGTFSEKNPAAIYLVGDRVFDCATHAEAVFHTAWFNTGLDDQEADHCMINQLRIESPSTAQRIELRHWHAAQMPKESQDQWAGQASTMASHFAGVPRGTPLDLVFEVNIYDQWREPSGDNEVHTPIVLHASPACTTPAPAQLPAQPIRRVNANEFEIQSAWAAQLALTPKLFTQGVALAPRIVPGAGMGFVVFQLNPDSLPARLGIQKGDIIFRIQGNAITSNTPLLAMSELFSSGELHVGLMRNRSSRSLTYRLR